jgi:DegV family protein with EDD domain
LSIKIVTDSTCDLPAEIIRDLDITVIPLYINFGDKGYLDGVEISRRDFYERLPYCNPLPTTATPGIDTFKNTYMRLAAEGATEILSIHISISLSATVNTARAAAGQTSAPQVTVFDSQQLSLGTGLLVRDAAQAAAEGKTMAAILEMLAEKTTRTYVFAALETLEYLRRSGRMNAAVAALGNALRIKPLLKMNQGQPTAERVRTHRRALERLIELVTELGPLEELALVHTNAIHAAENLYRKARHLFPVVGKPLSVDVTPVLGANLGPGVVGFTCVAAGRQQ